MEVDEIIENTVNRTVLKLKMAGLMKDDRKTAFQKTEELLRNYKAFKLSDQPDTKKLVAKMDEALSMIADDDYFPIISMWYFNGYTREEIAWQFKTTETTISRNKTRLINLMKAVIFSDDVIYELFL